MSKETNRLLGHSDEADGIDEYDNPLPDWWVGLFWLTIVWAIGYGVHYHFITREEFQAKVDADEFIEHAEFSGNCYGTLRSEVEDRLRAGKDVIIEIEVQGALQIKEAAKDGLLKESVHFQRDLYVINDASMVIMPIMPVIKRP